MKSFLMIALTGIAIGLAACSSGSSNVPPPTTSYAITGYQLNKMGTNNCNVDPGTSTITCQAGTASANQFQVTYVSTPGSYLDINTLTPPSGVSIAVDGSCPQIPSIPGQLYECNFSITNQGGQDVGTTINIPINGPLGAESFINVIFN